MENEQRNKTNIKVIKKIGGILLTIVISASVLTGVGFGFAKAVNEAPSADTSFNNKVQITTTVDFKGGSDKNIYDAAEYLQDTLEFLGLQNSTVDTIGKNTLLISNPIISYDDMSSDGITNVQTYGSTDSDIPELIEMMDDPSNNQNYINEIYSFILPILLNGTIDFRTMDGDAIFQYNKGKYLFIEPTASEADPSTYYSTLSAVQNFYTDAKVTQVNGTPVIEIGIIDHGNDNDGYINMFNDFNTWLLTNREETSTVSSEYMIYFDFELVSNILMKLFPSDITDITMVDDYVLSHESLRTLYLTSSSLTIMSSKYDDTIKISGDFNDKQAKYFVKKINNGNDMTYGDVSISLLLDEKSKVILLVMAILLLILIITIIFSFVSYFGLLGVITSIGFLLTSLFMVLIFASIGLSISGLVLGSLMFSMLISAALFYQATNVYKINNKDKFISITTRFIEKYKEIHKSLFFSTFSLVVIIYISALMLATAITLPLYLISISIVISYAIISFLFLPMVYCFDLLLEFSKEENNKKWFWLDGYNNNLKNNINFEVKGIKQKSLGVSLFGIIVLLLSLIMGGSLYAITGSAVNANLYGTQDYVYNIRLTEEEAVDLVGDSGYAEVGPLYLVADGFKGKVESIIDDNGAKVNNIEVIRFDEIFPDGFNQDNVNPGLWSSFGFQITSTTDIDTNQKNEINIALGDIGYKLTDEMSMINGASEKVVSYTENKYVANTILALLILAIITALIAMLVSNWGVSLAVLATTLLEIIFIVSPIFILFIPYNLLIWFPIFVLLTISASLKINMAQEARKIEIKKDRWIKVSKKRVFIIPIASAILFIIEFLLIWVYSFIIILPLLLITLFIPVVIFFVQQFVFPFFSEILGDLRDRIKENKLKDDIRNSKEAKENKESKEEMIEGVNM